MDNKKPIDISNMGMISHSYDKLSEGENIILRVGEELYRGRYLSCTHDDVVHSLRALPDHVTFKFSTFPYNKHVIGKLSKHSGPNRSRHIFDEKSGKRINIFVERVGKFSGLSAYRDWKRNEGKLSKELPDLPESVDEVFKAVHADVPEVIREAMNISPKKENTLPLPVLETIAHCKLDGSLPELIRVAQEVLDGTSKLGVKVTIEL